MHETLVAAGQNHASRFEPAIQFVLAMKQARIVASHGSAEEKRESLKTIGSNLRFVPRNAWQLVVDTGRFAQHNAAPPIDVAALVGETARIPTKAEEVRFELTGPLRAHRFSRPAHSATLPLLRRSCHTAYAARNFIVARRRGQNNGHGTAAIPKSASKISASWQRFDPAVATVRR